MKQRRLYQNENHPPTAMTIHSKVKLLRQRKMGMPELVRSPGEGIGYPLQYSWASLVAQMAKNPPICNAGDPCSISGSGRSPGEGIGYPLQHSQVSLVVQLVKQYGRPGFSPWVGKIPWRREKPSTPVFLPREFHGLYSPWSCKEFSRPE